MRKKCKPILTISVLVREAWDEQVVDGYRSIQNETGEDLTGLKDAYAWCESHNCRNHCWGNGPCASDVTVITAYKTVHHDAEYKTVTETVHHDAEYKTVTTPAQTHTVNHPAEYRTVKKCSECGAQK